MRKPVRKAASKAKAAPRKKTAPVRAGARRIALVPDLTPADVASLEELEHRYRRSEQAWLQMTTPPEGEDRWSQVEEHLLARRADDADRRWKYFSK